MGRDMASEYQTVEEIILNGLGQKQITKKDAVASFSLHLKRNYFLEERAPKRLLKRSTRPPVSTIRCLPV